MTVQDHIAVDLNQIELVIRIEMLEALQRVMSQIEAVLREIYPDTDDRVRQAEE
jgi:hypothetical protein